ncbi:hypothetical protein Hanom_Chr05g00404651 [Helianthus anomalus]
MNKWKLRSVYLRRAYYSNHLWCGVPPLYIFTVKYLMEVHGLLIVGKKAKRIIHGLIIIVCRCI